MAPRAGSKFGGAALLRILVKGGPDLFDAVLSKAEGGTKLESGLANLVADRAPGTRVELSTEGGEACGRWWQRLVAGNGEGHGIPPGTDIVLLSSSSDLATPVEEFRRQMARLVSVLKEAGAHVLILNCSSFDPMDRTTSYSAVEDSWSLRVHYLNRELVALSMSEGVSIVDVDRLIAGLGGAEHVPGALNYSTVACDAIAREVLRVIQDYGFLEARPLVAQVGRRGGHG